MSTLLALLLAVAGLGLRAAAMPQHWRQLFGIRPLSDGRAAALRLAGALVLLGSLLLCLAGAHPTIAILVWVMLLSLAAVLVAAGLALRT
jgi:hypothetical protein